MTAQSEICYEAAKFHWNIKKQIWLHLNTIEYYEPASVIKWPILLRNGPCIHFGRNNYQIWTIPGCDMDIGPKKSNISRGEAKVNIALC
jgi:hypothetical protein